jgi:hypothetical protein
MFCAHSECVLRVMCRAVRTRVWWIPARSARLSRSHVCVLRRTALARCDGGPVTRELEPSLHEHVRVVAFACEPLFAVARSAALHCWFGTTYCANSAM